MALKLAVFGLVLVALAVIGVGLRAASREAASEARFPAQGQILTVKGRKIHAAVMGTGPDLVLIHGSNGNLRDMTYALTPKLADRYRVILFDRPGLGYSDAGPASGATLREQAGILAEAARQLGAEKPIVAGQSYGGAVALAWAVHHPDRLSALVPIASASNPWEGPLDPIYRLTSHPLGAALVVPLIAGFAGQGNIDRALVEVFAPQPVPEGYSGHVGATLALRRGSFRANARQRANILGEITELAPLYETIPVPTEIIHGDADVIVPLATHSEILATQIPDATLTRLPGVGHMPHQVAPDAVVAAIDRAALRAGLREQD